MTLKMRRCRCGKVPKILYDDGFWFVMCAADCGQWPNWNRRNLTARKQWNADRLAEEKEKMNQPLTYQKWEVTIELGHYSNGRLAIQLMGTNGELITTATVNLPDDPLGENEIFVKDWGYQSGMMKWLEANGIAKDTGQRVPTGHVEATKAILTEGIREKF